MDEPKTLICANCGECFSEDELTAVGGELFCRSCLEEETLICNRCGEIILRDDNAGDEDTPLCQSCYDDYYERCSDCGAVIRRDQTYYADDDDIAYCYSCYCNHKTKGCIHDYYYKPEPIFYGDGNRYFGVELEVDEGGEDDENAREVLELANAEEEHIYCKHDGSLNDGFEIVTHPMTLEYHKNSMPWDAVLHKARELGYLSHQAGTCGLHVHVNRTAFGSTQRAQDAVIARILYFVERFWNELLRFSRRTQRQLDHWAARYGYKEHPAEILDHAKKGSGLGRYSCVNLQNRDTIEFRIFRGTLRLNTLLSTLELVDRICDVSLYLSDEDLKALSWPEFVSSIRNENHPELVQYLKERRLYVNEAVQSEEDV